ncbi:SAM-dependent methyltransferase [Colwelliaceae bacterium 6441]
MENKQVAGSIICVGLGMTLGSHISPLSRSYVEEADIVFVLASDGIVEQWVSEMNTDVRSLQSYYREGESRLDTYKQMIDAMLNEVIQGHKVVGAFYGHPGVFACVPHRAIAQANQLGYYARMEPGISAEDCLYADLNIDPGEFGCAHYETSQFMFYKRNIESSAYLILWQVGIAGDTSLTKFSTGQRYRQVLVELLEEEYGLAHQVILYEAPTLPIHAPRIERFALSSLVEAQINQQTTLVIPPSKEMIKNEEVFRKLSELDEKQRFLKVV